MAKYVEIADLANKELNLLPIRKGCYGGPCACLGTCRDIVGYVPRKEYGYFIEHQLSLDEFLDQYVNDI